MKYVLQKDYIPAAALVAMGAAGVWTSLHIELDSLEGWGARVFPIFASVALCALGVLEFLKTSFAFEVNDEKVFPSLRPWFIIGLTLAYIWMVARFGYHLSTALISPAIFATFGIRSPIFLFASAVLVPFFFHVLFFELLGIFPPIAKWFDPFVMVRGY